MTAMMAALVADMETISTTRKYTVEAQVRAYDLLSCLLEAVDNGVVAVSEEAAQEFKTVWQQNADVLSAAYDETALKAEAAEMIKPLEKACNDARFNAAAAASLHEFAKETFQTWQTAGIFARRRALKALRERAGFRLEQHRIGNYVAKTFDLMNQATPTLQDHSRLSLLQISHIKYSPASMLRLPDCCNVLLWNYFRRFCTARTRNI